VIYITYFLDIFSEFLFESGDVVFISTFRIPTFLYMHSPKFFKFADKTKYRQYIFLFAEMLYHHKSKRQGKAAISLSI